MDTHTQFWNTYNKLVPNNVRAFIFTQEGFMVDTLWLFNVAVGNHHFKVR